jgi:hypothetical protein
MSKNILVQALKQESPAELSAGVFPGNKPMEVMKTIAAAQNSNNAAGPVRGTVRGPAHSTTSQAARDMVDSLFALK